MMIDHFECEERAMPKVSLPLPLFFSLSMLFLFFSSAYPAERWEYFVPGNDIHDVAFQGDYIWCATTYSIVRWDRRDMSYIQYTVKDYGGNSYPEHLAVDAHGNLWVGFWYGERVARFDGAIWTAFDRSESPFPGVAVEKILADRAGNVWFAGWKQGLKRFDGAVWHNVSNPGNSVFWNIYDMAEDPNGALWFATDDGLTRFDGFSWRTWTMEEGLPGNIVTAVAAGPDGRIWFVSGGKLGCFYDESFSIYPAPVEGERGGLPYFQGPIAVDEKGTVWACSSSDESTQYVKGLWSFRDSGWEFFPPDFGIEGYISGVYPDQQGTIWYITSLGLASWDGRERSLHRVNAPDHTNSSQIATDRKGEVWLASSNTAGVTYVARYDQYSWKVFAPGIIPEIVSMSIQIDSNDRKWFPGAWYLDGDSLRIVISHTELPDYGFDGFAVEGDGSTLWFGSESKGLYRWMNGVWTNYTTADGLPSNTIIPRAVGPDGILWCSSGVSDGNQAGGHGIAWFDGTAWREYPFQGGANSIAFGKNGEAWFGTWSGILRYVDGQWTEFREMPGVKYPAVQSLAVDADGNLWAADVFHGAFRYDGRAWKLYTTADGLLSNRVSAVGVDAGNRKWFATSAGYCILDESAPASVTESAPAPFALLGNRPNPFNASTLIEFTLPAPGAAQLAIYDITGRKVRDLSPGKLPAGRNAVLWDGRDATGREASSGVYIARLTFGQHAVAGRMALVK